MGHSDTHASVWHNTSMVNSTVFLYPFLFLGLIIVVFYGFSLLYHWLRYGSMYPLVWIALPVYVVGTIVFIGAMITGLAAA